MKLSEAELACALHDKDELRAHMARQLVEAMRRLTLAENALAEALQLSGYQMENESDSDAMASIYTRCLATLNAIRSEADV